MSEPSGAKSAPPAAVALGVGGLAPFVGLAVLALGAPALRAGTLHALLGYGAVILSFVGALHWGYAVKRNALGSAAWIQYGWSVVPALVAWGTLLLPIATGLRLQAAALVACLVVDHAMSRTDPMPAWLLRLRAILTTAAVVSLTLASLV